MDFLQQMLKCNKEAEAAEAAAQVDKKRLEASSVEDVPRKERKKGQYLDDHQHTRSNHPIPRIYGLKQHLCCGMVSLTVSIC